jgi:hypothetical protein
MSENNRQIQEIIQELQRLHLRQTTLVDRLQQLTRTRDARAPSIDLATRVHVGPATRAPRSAPAVPAFAVAAPAARVSAVEDTGSATSSEPRPPPTAPREFGIGDRVRVTNPGPGQSPIGIIVKISPAQFHIRARNGNEIRRTAKNLIRLD